MIVTVLYYEFIKFQSWMCSYWRGHCFQTPKLDKNGCLRRHASYWSPLVNFGQPRPVVQPSAFPNLDPGAQHHRDYSKVSREAESRSRRGLYPYAYRWMLVSYVVDEGRTVAARDVIAEFLRVLRPCSEVRCSPFHFQTWTTCPKAPWT